MKALYNILSSSKLALLLLFIFAVSVGAATFIENTYDTNTAQVVIYRAKWFEIVLYLLIINFILHIPKYKLTSKEKLPVFILHLSLIIILVGAGITRHFGYEGSMPIKEGETSSRFYTLEPSLQIFATDDVNQYNFHQPLYFTEITDNDFEFDVKFGQQAELEVSYVDFISDAKEEYEEFSEGGVDILEVVTNDANGRVNFWIKEGESRNIGNQVLTFGDDGKPSSIQILKQADGSLKLNTPYAIATMKMPTMVRDTIEEKSLVDFETMKLHMIKGGGQFVFKKLHKQAKKVFRKVEEDEEGGQDFLTIKLKQGETEETLVLQGGINRLPVFKRLRINNLLIQIGYGARQINLPFSIALNDFILDRYPGSNSPSSYKSIITLFDERSGLIDRREIFMNNVMDYGGFRFFQSGYEPDESGTILSVNHDEMGTKVTYMGYALLALGFLLSFFDKRSRFQTVRKLIVQSRKKRLMLWFLALASFSVQNHSFAQDAEEHAQHETHDEHNHEGHNHDEHAHHNHQFQNELAQAKQQFLQRSLSNYKAVDQEHADFFGQLIYQTREGRFQPINSLAIDILHKISRQDQIKIDSVGKLSPMQVMLDFMIAPDFWKTQNIIYIRNATLAKEIGFENRMVSFSDFFDDNGVYKLQEYTEVAFRKKPSEQNAFDKEIIKLDERINIFMMVMRGTLLQIFPQTGDENHKWMNWTDSLANVPIGNIDSELKSDSIRPIDEVTYSNLLMLYNMALIEAKQDDDYTLSNQIVKSISKLQRSNTPAELLPSEELINAEILYNKLNIFKRLERMYSIFALFLLILSLLEVSIKNKATNRYTFLVKAPLKFFMISLFLAFLYHTFGMGMRWYLSGHAPWSNGYEALLLIAWATLLSGFIFSRYSKITLAATALLAFFILMTAGHSNYDPQLTNLQPVLKSYWLIIHVAAITSSYGFFGLAFILGLINLCFYAFQNYSNKKHISSLVQELTYISELTINIGLMLAAVGTFLGGIWANESWGRYWGWDAKETWALVVVLTYAIILHFRFIPGLKDKFWFNVGSVLGFSSVLMTFVGVNYYLSKGLHSYARGEAPAFPLWAWYSIFAVFVLIFIAFLRRKKLEN